MSRPSVLVVRSGANPFASIQEGSGLEIVEVTSHTIETVAPPPDAFAEAADLAIFTSQVAVERVGSDPSLRGSFSAALRGGRVAAVGPATAEALRAHGIEPQFVAAGSSEALLDLLPGRLDGWRVLVPCGEDGAEDLPERLRLRGARAERIVVYRKIPRPPDPTLDRRVRDHPFAAFCVTSPSAATWLFASLGNESARIVRETPAVVLGRFTRRFLERQGVSRIEVAPEPRLAAAVRLLEELATARPGA